MHRSHLFLSLLFCSLLVISLLTPPTSSQSTLRSLSLNGTTAYAEVANSTSLNITGPVTVEAWIKVNAIDGNPHDIVSRINRNEAGSGGGYELIVNDVGKLRLNLFQAHNQSTMVIGTTVLTTGVWHHVAGVFDGSQARVYVNGVLDGSLNTTNSPASGTSLLRIGRAAHAANSPPLYLPSYAFAGLIDEARVTAAAVYSANFTPATSLSSVTGTRGLWKFDNQSVTDSSGNNNNCTLFGDATFSTDVPTSPTLNSLSLNGTTAYADVANSTSLNITGPVTVEAWIKVNAIDGNLHDIVSRINRNEAGSGGGYELIINDVGKLRLNLFQAHNQSTMVIGTTVLTTGVWHHVAGVFDGSQARLYVNGVLDGSLNTTNSPASGTSLLRIGRAAHAANSPPLYLPSYAFAGLIDEARVTAAAVYSANFTPATSLSSVTGTRGLWKFDNQSVTDSSGNNNTASLQGGATYSTDVPSAPNSGPSVILTDPLNNTAFASGANIVMDATASDSDGSVTKVDFYQGTTLLGTDTTAPYTFVWTNVPVGSYSLTAKATDDGNATTTSSAIAVTVVASGSYHSLSVNGTTAYADVPNSTSLNITGPITVEAWIKVNAIDGNAHVIVSRINRNEAGSGGGYEIEVNGVGKLRMDLFQSHNTYTTLIGTTVLTTGVWHHVAGVFDGSQMRVYLNGVLDGSLNTTNSPASGTSLLRIGRAAHAALSPPLYLPSFAFAGLIDEARVSAAALYTSNFTPGLGPGTNVRGLWKFDGQTANDFSGNGNNGSLQGGATYSTDVPPTGGPQRPVPVAGGPYSGQLAQAVQFSSSGSFDPDGTISAYHWNFGDGTSANTANPAHTYAAPGLYTATLTVTDNAGLLASATAAVTISNDGNARLEPLNQTGGGGENPLSRNFNWNLPLVSLPGRAGMDLNLMLAYNSLVWTKSGSYISFDDDRGFPGPGFRLGFPVIQPLYYNSEVGKYAFLLIGSDGSRTELRQVGTSALYESADSSHLLLDASTMVLRTTDGTQLSYALIGNEYNCTQIKDRNGNYITVNYTASGRIDTIVDTLARSIKFNYDASGWLSSITQVWNQGTASQVTHNWATFAYTDTTIQTDFPGLTVYGPSNNTNLKTLQKVTLADGSHYDFSYTSWGQVWKVSSFSAEATPHLLNYRAYKLPGSPLETTGPQSDCPRFSERHDWAENWNQNLSGIEQEAITTYAITPVPYTWTMPDGTQQTGIHAQVTAPDLTFDRIYFTGTAGTASGWRRGLPALVNTYDSSGVLQRQVMTTWTQDNTSVSYPLNPRVIETNTYDPAGNRARVQITYQQVTFTNGTSCQLPRDVYEYAANATTILRSTRTDYHTSTIYADRRIIGLVSEKRLYEGDVNNGGALKSKVGFFYDNENGVSSIQGTDTPVQHDNTNYSASFVTGRANLSSIRRYDVNNTALFTTTSSKYNTAGALVSTTDASNHLVQLSYADSFSDGNARNTLAYPTTVTDPDSYTSTTKYNFDYGAVTSRRTPQPNTTQNLPGPEQTFTYDTIGRLQLTNQVNGAYTRYEYPISMTRVDTYATIQEGLGEAHSFRISDGAGRVIATAKDHPGSIGGFSGQKFVYDLMGRLIKTSNPTETNASGAPSQWVTAGDDSSAGWIYTQQTYDWKGRPLVTTNQDGTTKTVSYTGCGCAGGEVVTLTDEGTIDAGIAKKRQQKIYKDVLGRTKKTEILNWEGGGVYSTTVNAYNARDQITQVRQYAGPETSGTFQETTMTYDGYGRLKTRHLPQEDANTNTIWTYNSDDTINTITDPRTAVTTFGYNNRHLVTSVAYTLSGSSTINRSYSYDAAGNRLSASQTVGGTAQDSASFTYDVLSRMTLETKHISALSGNSMGGDYTISYDYTVASKTTITDPFGSPTDLNYDFTGRTSSVTGSYGGTNYTYVSNIGYRAWGAVKSVSFNNSLPVTVSYNNRLQPTQYRGNPGRYDYSYYDDGRLKQLTDLDDVVGNASEVTFHYMSRVYSYDKVGRVSSVGAVPNSNIPAPFIGNYGYDEFSNMTSRSGHYALNADQNDTSSYTNNRRDGWTYDAAGHLTATTDPSTSSTRIWAYNAAGELSSVSETTSGSTVTNTITYDYDGQLFYESVLSGGVATSNYMIRSTVLGTNLTKLDSAGNKGITYVPANGLAKPLQTKDGGGTQFVLLVTRDALGIQENDRASDPFGNLIQNVQPPSFGPPPTTPSYGPTFGGLGSWAFTNANNLSVGCTAEARTPESCSNVIQDAMRHMPASFWENLPGSPADPYAISRYEFNMNRTIYRDKTGQTGYADDSYDVFYGDVNSSIVTIFGGAAFVENWVPAPGSLNPKTNPYAPQNPQNPVSSPLTADEVGVLYSDLKNLLTNPDCAGFIEAVLQQLITDTGRTNYDTTDILTLLDRVKTGRGFDWQPGLNAQARAGGGFDHNGKNIASMSIKPTQGFANLSNRSSSVSRGRIVSHELFHVAGYDHRAMAMAAYAVGGRFDQSWRAWRGDFPDSQNDRFFSGPNRNELLDGAYSGFFKNVLDQYCK